MKTKHVLMSFGCVALAVGLSWPTPSRTSQTCGSERAINWHRNSSLTSRLSLTSPISVSAEKTADRLSHAARAAVAAERGPQADAVRKLLADVAAGRLVLPKESESEPLDLTRPDIVPLIVRLWAMKNSADASAWAKALPESDDKSASLRQIALLLARSDSSAALQWVSGLETGPSREAALESMATEFASANPAQALQLAAAMAPSQSRDQTLIHALSQWGALDPSAALTYARAVNDPNLRANALAAVTVALANTDPATAGTVAAQEITDGAAQSRAVVSIVQRWAQMDPAAVASWVGQFEPGPTSDNAVEQLVVRWSLQDSTAPSRWLATVTDDEARDCGYASLARFLAPSQPVQATQYAALISDPQTRQRCLLALVNQ